MRADETERERESERGLLRCYLRKRMKLNQSTRSVIASIALLIFFCADFTIRCTSVVSEHSFHRERLFFRLHLISHLSLWQWCRRAAFIATSYWQTNDVLAL